MFDFNRMIRTAVASASVPRPTIAAVYELPERLCRDLVAEGLIGGYLSGSPPSALGDGDPCLKGWWTDRREKRWFLRLARSSPALILLGGTREYEVGGYLLLEARLKGFRRLLMADESGAVFRDIDIEAHLVEMLDGTASDRFDNITFENAYRDIYDLVGDRLRLPPESFAQDRVLLMVGSLGPGGAERQVAETAAGLVTRYGLEVHIGCNHIAAPADFFRPLVEKAGARVAVVPNAGALFEELEFVEIRNKLAPYAPLGMLNVFHMIFHYALLIREVRPSVVHTWMDYCNVLAGIAADLVGVPNLVLSGRSVAPDNFPLLFQPYMKPGYLSLLAQRRIIFLNNSRAGANDYARWLHLSREQFRVIPNGFSFPDRSLQESKASARRRHGILDEARVVGSITRFSEEKQPQLFIDMALALHRTYPDLRFLMFGGGTMLEAMRSYVESQGASGFISLPGITPDPWSALAAMDVFVLTSRMEGLANVLVEAQAAGVPVVCTGVGGMVETYVEGESGFGVPSATPQSLADAVARLLNDPELYRRMSDRASKHARDNFGVERMVSLTAEAYREAEALRPSANQV